MILGYPVHTSITSDSTATIVRPSEHRSKYDNVFANINSVRRIMEDNDDEMQNPLQGLSAESVGATGGCRGGCNGWSRRCNGGCIGGTRRDERHTVGKFVFWNSPPPDREVDEMVIGI